MIPCGMRVLVATRPVANCYTLFILFLKEVSLHDKAKNNEELLLHYIHLTASFPGQPR